MNGIHGARVERSLTKSHPFVVQSVQEADHKLVCHGGGTPSQINKFSAQLTLFSPPSNSSGRPEQSDDWFI